MSAEATIIRDMRSSTVAVDASYTSYFRSPQKKIFDNLRCRERGSQATSLPHPIHPSEYVAGKWLSPQCAQKCATAPLCINHMSCYAEACTPCRKIRYFVPFGE
ncbi:hypothetical protein TNCV_211551 [Trichonephila clavipes]|uniref:Uncharacterized protein n=1 Tax=Trichonephila clavipes TaxID=2585209 RepID=A0A8X6T7F7_TRICX|nr:hypothetical protein TNCV_211551 [Trichonephila clavipes]